MNNNIDTALSVAVLEASGAKSIADAQVVQSLWGGYGQIVRCWLKGGSASSVIVKRVRWPELDLHQGDSRKRSHLRKVKSYEIETIWYERYAQRCADSSRVPRCMILKTQTDGVLMVLEDLDAAGFSARRQQVTDVELRACLSWLAHFHAEFLGTSQVDLWKTGTYWHLETRPDELAVMGEGRLKDAAHLIDHRLSDSPFQTLLHGDAKLANFCFSEDGRHAAAVDFQYTGSGCGMKDVAYFFSSTLNSDECESMASGLLDFYFAKLREALTASRSDTYIDALEANWRSLYPFAWADFFRFLLGWSPDHWKLHEYSEGMTRQALQNL